MKQNIFTYNELDGTMVITYQDKESGEITKTLKYKDGVLKVVYEKPLSSEQIEDIHNKMKQSFDDIKHELDSLLKAQKTNQVSVYVSKAIETLYDVLVQNNMVDTEKYNSESFAVHFVSKMTDEEAEAQGAMTVGQIFAGWQRGQHYIVDNSLAVWEWHNTKKQQ